MFALSKWFCQNFISVNFQNREFSSKITRNRKTFLLRNPFTNILRNIYSLILGTCATLAANKKSELIIGRFQTLFRKSVKFSNFDKMFGASYFSSKITPTARIWAAYTLRGRRYWQKYSWIPPWEKYLIKCKISKIFIIIGISMKNSFNQIRVAIQEISDMFYFWNIHAFRWILIIFKILIFQTFWHIDIVEIFWHFWTKTSRIF